MKTYVILIEGCHDTTYLKMELNEEQLNLVTKISEQSQQYSDYGCKPIMNVYLYDKEEHDYIDEEIEEALEKKKTLKIKKLIL